MINAACISAYIPYCTNVIKKREELVCRYEFMIELGQQLTKPWMDRRLEVKNLLPDLCQNIMKILKI